MTRKGIPMTHVIVALLAASGAMGRQQGTGAPPQELAAQHVEVRRVIWPIYAMPTDPARQSEACNELGPEAVAIEEDGEPVEVVRVEKNSAAVVHALLLDTSNSMRRRGRIQLIREAALRYVSQVPDSERVLLATFDDDLSLLAPPMTDRARLAESIRRIEPGNMTALWDSVYDLVRYLDTLEGQKVMVLFSDGADSSSQRQGDPKTILELIANRPDVTVFPVGTDLAGDRGPGRRATRKQIRRLADATGGFYEETRGVEGLADVFERIRLRLDRRFFATYVPPANHGDENRLRRVAVRSGSKGHCRVSTAGPAWRRGGAPSPVADSRGPVAELERVDTPGLLVGQVIDVTRERGLLFDRDVYEATGRLQTSFNETASVAPRTAVVEIPSIDVVRGFIRSPEDVLLRLLRMAPGREEKFNVPASLLVHGETFFEMRRSIGVAVFSSRTDYREWATTRLTAVANHDSRRLLDDLRRSGEISPVEVAAIENALLERARNPEDVVQQRLLADWLGDVESRDLVLALERKLVDRWIRSAPGSSTRREIAFVADSRWSRIHEVFPPASGIRTVAMLVPAYDVDRDLFGFYRVRLAAPRLNVRPVVPLPETPLALALVRQLTESGELVPCGPIVARSITYESLSQDEHLSLEALLAGSDLAGYESNHSPVVWRVRLQLGPDQASPAALDLEAYFEPGRWEPMLMTACPADQQSAARIGWSPHRLSLARRHVELPCGRERVAATPPPP